MLAQKKVMKIRALVLTLLMGPGFVAGPVLGAAAPQAPSPAATSVSSTPAPAPEAALSSTPSPVPADYIIGPGDTLQIFVWRNPELGATVPVRPDGKISTPLVEDMVAVGKNPSALARDVEKVLAEYVRSPQVNVIVTQPASVFSHVNIIGQVARPFYI
jgi:polysaccharide export outer membrane protein